MTNNPARTTGEQGTGAAAGTAADQLLDAVREAAGRAFTVVGHLGPNAQGVPAFLASDPLTGELTILLLQADQRGEDDTAFGLVEIRTLDAATPTFGARCRTCNAPLPNWEPQCPVCGADAAGAVSAAGQSPADLLGVVRALAGDDIEVLGAMRREMGGGEVYFARPRGTNQLSVVRLMSGGPGGQALDITPITVSYGGSLGAGAEGASAGGAAAAARPTPVAAPPEPETKICPHCGAVYGSEVRFCPNDGSTLRAKSGAKGLIGQILADRYHVSKKLGEGGMGEVYLAEQFKIGRQCAIKVMRTMLMDDADAAARFNAEASNACRINHGNVAAIYDFGEATGGIVYLAMEFVDGEPLSATLAREGRLAPDRVAAIGYQTADALSAAHELGIVHRDLKPDNIMLARGRDGRDLVKVVDFGIAKAIRTDGRGVTRTGFVLGTPAYMSPEQVTGESLDGRSDIYSLGCILFECLTGRLPFEKGSGGVQLTRRLAEPAPHPRQINRDIPKAIDMIVVKALARSRGDRYDSAATLRDCLAQQSVAPRRGILGFSALRFGGRSQARQPMPTPAATAPPTSMSPTVPQRQALPDVARLQIRTAVTRARPAVPAPSPVPPKSPHVARPSLSTTRRASRDVPASTDPVPATVAIAPRVNPLAVPRRPRSVVLVVAGVVAAVVLGLVVARQMTQRSSDAAATVGSTERQVTGSRPRPDSSALPSANAAAHPPASGAAAATVSDQTASPTPPPPSSRPASDSVAVRAAFERAFRQAAASAAASRAMATAAGATTAEFRVGDSLRRAGAAAAAAHDGERALANLMAARQYWDRVAQAARARGTVTAQAQPAAPAVTGGAPSPVSPPAGSPEAKAAAQPAQPVQPAPQPAASSTAALRAPPVAASSTAVPAPAADDAGARSRAATQTVAAYVAALNSRDLGHMKQLYPTMPAGSQSGFSDLFASATDFSAQVLSLPAAVVNGNSADVVVSYSIDYYLSSQGRKHVTARLHAILKQSVDGWRIESLAPAN